MYGYKPKSEFSQTLGIYMVNCPEWNIADNGKNNIYYNK